MEEPTFFFFSDCFPAPKFMFITKIRDSVPSSTPIFAWLMLNTRVAPQSVNLSLSSALNQTKVQHLFPCF